MVGRETAGGGGFSGGGGDGSCCTQHCIVRIPDSRRSDSMIYTRKCTLVRTTSGMKNEVGCACGLTDEGHGLTGFALGDVRQGV